MRKQLFFERFLSVLFALAFWQFASMALKQPLLLPSPVRTAERFLALFAGGEAWKTVGYSFFRIEAGFFLGLFSGCFFAALSVRFRWVEILLWPFLAAVKSVPVASFIILALVWLDASGLSVFISFLMVLPAVYFNVLEGIRDTDRKLLEAARVFRMSGWKKLIYIYLPQVKPFLLSACTVSMGISWKAGIAAEVIGIPAGSLGERLYEAKIYLDIADLFAWTFAAVVVCTLFERLFLWVVNRFFDRLEKR